MSGLWDQPGVPHKNWSCFNIVDLNPDDDPDNDDYASCQMCGQESIRYVYYMQHPKYPDEMEVGRVCAEKMTDNYVKPRQIEKRLKNKASRRHRWLSRKWRTSRKGNPYLRINGQCITICKSKFDKWSFFIGDHPAGAWFASEDQAKLAAFEELEKFKPPTAT